MISAGCLRLRGPWTVTVAGMRPDEYRSYDALGLADLVRSRQITAGELLDLALEQTAATDDQIAAVVYMQVDRARRAIAAGLPDGPFTGVPFLIKDLGCDAVDFPTCMGSGLYRDYRYSVDSELFIRLERAGLVTFARTTSPEFGIGPTGEARVYGQADAQSVEPRPRRRRIVGGLGGCGRSWNRADRPRQ